MPKPTPLGEGGGGAKGLGSRGSIDRTVIKISPSLNSEKNPSYKVSENVKVVPSKTNNSGRMVVNEGARQAARQNAKGTQKGHAVTGKDNYTRPIK
jgi:hypothetical protein